VGGELTDLIHARSGGRPYHDHREQSWEEVVAATGLLGEVQVARFGQPGGIVAGPGGRARALHVVRGRDGRRRPRVAARRGGRAARHRDATAGRDHFDYPHDTVVYLCPKPT